MLLIVTSTEGGAWTLVLGRKATCPSLKAVSVAQGCHCLQHTRCLSSHPKVSCWRLQPMGLRAFCLDFFLHHVLVPQWLSQALQRPTCFQKHGDTRSHLVHCSHRGFCLSSSPVLCRHLTAHTDIPKPPSHSQTVFDSITFFTFFFSPLFFFLLLTSKESFVFPIRLLVKKQLQSVYFVSLELNYLSLSPVKFLHVGKALPQKPEHQ